MLSTGREVLIGKNCAQFLEYGLSSKAKCHAQDQGHSFCPIVHTNLDWLITFFLLRFKNWEREAGKKDMMLTKHIAEGIYLSSTSG